MNKYKAVVNKTERELKDIAIALYNNDIYTYFQIGDLDRHHISMVFMPLMFMGPHPPFSGDIDTARLRANRIWELLDKDEEERAYKEDFLPSIGLVYEYYSTDGNHNTFPRSLNGMPLFHSCRFLNLEDTDKLRDYYEQYIKIRKEADNF